MLDRTLPADKSEARAEDKTANPGRWRERKGDMCNVSESLKASLFRSSVKGLDTLWLKKQGVQVPPS